MQPMLRRIGFILKNDVDDDDVDDVIEAHPVSAQSTSIKLKHSYLTDELAKCGGKERERAQSAVWASTSLSNFTSYHENKSTV